MTPRPVQRTPGSVAAACTADYACTIFPTKTLSDPGACGVTNRRGIKLCHQILTSNWARTDQLNRAAVLRAMESRDSTRPMPPGLSSIGVGSNWIGAPIEHGVTMCRDLTHEVEAVKPDRA